MSRETSLAQLGAAAKAFEAHFGAGAGAVEAARHAGFRLLKSLEECVYGEPDTHGNEHNVWMVSKENERRVFKITRGLHAIYGVSGDSVAYLHRWLNSNRVFGDDIRIEGTLPDGRFVISQLFIEGGVPSTIQLHQALQKTGWVQYRNSGTVWTSPDGRMVMSEVHNGNFIVQPDGTVSAIDVALHSRDEWEAQLDPVEFAEAYGPDFRPQTLADLLDSVGGDLTRFGFRADVI